MSRDTKKSRVAVVGLNPGFMRTEGVLMYMTTEERKRQFRFDLSESPEYIGRAVAALATCWARADKYAPASATFESDCKSVGVGIAGDCIRFIQANGQYPGKPLASDYARKFDPLI